MEKIRIAIVGAGSRGADCYGQALLEMKDRAQVVAVAEEPRADRRNAIADAHGVPEENRLETGEELLARPKLARRDAHLHAGPPARPAGGRRHAAGIRPADGKAHLARGGRAARDRARPARNRARRRGLPCASLHALSRGARTSRSSTTGAIGEVVAIQAWRTSECWHQAHSFVRGNWRNAGLSSPMIMQKCCHDLDYLVWLSAQRCERVATVRLAETLPPGVRAGGRSSALHGGMRRKAKAVPTTPKRPI